MTLAMLQADFRDWLTEEGTVTADHFGKGAALGLAVYLNNYRSQLIACLSDSYGVTRTWLGDEAFEGSATNHIDRLPPHSWTLDAYALDFPVTIDELYPEDPEVGDLARLERALGTAFVAADSTPVTAADLAAVDWDVAILEPAPSLSLLTVSSNAAAIWSAIMTDGAPPPAKILHENFKIAVWREEFSPVFRTLDEIESLALTALLSGQSFASICATIEQRGGAEGLTRAGELLGRWIGDGMIARVRY